MKRIIDLTVDFQNKMYSTISLKQMDTTEIRVQLLNNNTIVNLTSETVDILFTKPDNTIVQQNASSTDKENGKATIELLPDCLRKSGKAKMEIEIKDSNNELLSSFYIPIQIEQTSKENVISDNTPNYFEEFAQKINKFEKISNQMLENIGLAEEQRNVNEGNRETAEQLRIEAEQKREQEKLELEEETRKTIEELQTELRLTKQDLKAGTLEGENTGESLYLQDSSDARFREFGITGNSKQETREESNLYDKSTNITSKAVDINGEEYSSPGWALTDYIPILTVNKLLKYSGLTAVGNRPHSAFYDADKNFISSFKQAVGENTLEIPTNASYVRFTIEVASGDINTFNVSYVAMPSLEFPSEIQAVGQDVNIFDSSIFEDIEQSGVKIKRNSDGTFTLNGTYTGTSSWNYRFNLPNPIANTKEQLYLSMQKTEGNCTGQIRFIMWEANNDNRWLSFENNQYADLLKERTYTRASITIFSGATFDNLTIGLKISNKKDAMYSPYNHGSANVTVCNKNVLPIQLEETQTVNGITVTNNKGRLTINGTSTAGFQFDIAKNFYLPKSNSVFNPNEISGTVTNIEEGVFPTYSMRDADNVQLITGMANRVGKNIKKTISASLLGNIIKFCTLWIPKNTVFNNFVIEPQIEAGETATNYVEHEEQTFTVPVQQEMLEGDKFEKVNGVWKEKHSWGKKIFTGQENILSVNRRNTNTILVQANIAGCYIPNENEYGKTYAYSNCFAGSGRNIVFGDNANTVALGNSNSRILFNAPIKIVGIDEAEQLNNFKAKLVELYEAGTPVTAYYKLEEPTYLECTTEQIAVLDEIEKTLHTYKNGTHVYCTDEISPIFNVRYTRDQEAYIKNEINKMQAMILAGEE